MASVAPVRAASPAWIYRIVERQVGRFPDLTVEIVHVGPIDGLDEKLEAMLDAAGVLEDGAIVTVIGDANAHPIGVSIFLPCNRNIPASGNVARALGLCARLCHRAGGRVLRATDL